MNRWHAVVFDLDDTLYPERDFVLSGFQAVARWGERFLGIPYEQGYADLCALYESGVRGNTFELWLAMQDIESEKIVPQLVQVYRQHQPRIKPFPEVPASLVRLRSRYKLGLLSDGYLDVQQRKLAALGLEGYFDVIVFSDAWGRNAWKPSVKPFQITVQQLGVAPSSAVYVGDNPLKDFLGARRLGMCTVRIQRSGGEYAHLSPPTPEHAPDHVIGNLMELEQLLQWP